MKYRKYTGNLLVESIRENRVMITPPTQAPASVTVATTAPASVTVATTAPTWRPPRSLDGQWVDTVYGIKTLSAGWCERGLSWILFMALSPIWVLLFLIFAASSWCRPLVRFYAVGWQYLTLFVIRCAPSLYFGLLVLRLRQVFDFVWTSSLTLSYASYEDTLGSNSFFYYDGYYLGGFDESAAIISDPSRKRSLTLGSVIPGLPGSFSPCMPVFFDTGKPYHSAWRAAYLSHIIGRPELCALLADQVALQTALAPFVDEWLASAEPNAFHTRAATSRCVFYCLCRLLFGVPLAAVPADLATAATAYASGVGSFAMVAPQWAHGLTCGKLQQGYLAAARDGLADFLLAHCSADAPPSQLKGHPFDWAGMAASCLPQPAIPTNKRHPPLTGTQRTRLFVQSVVDATCFAGLIGTSTLVDTSSLPRLLGTYASEWHTRVEPQPTREEYLRLFEADPLAWLLEAIR